MGERDVDPDNRQLRADIRGTGGVHTAASAAACAG